jgi:hypothetical protein
VGCQVAKLTTSYTFILHDLTTLMSYNIRLKSNINCRVFQAEFVVNSVPVGRASVRVVWFILPVLFHLCSISVFFHLTSKTLLKISVTDRVV